MLRNLIDIALLRSRRVRWLVAAVLLAVLVLWLFVFRDGPAGIERSTTFAARRGDIRITVLEGGNVTALESQEIKSEVQGQTKILYIVEEGYRVTEDDVEDEKVLVELDSKDLVDKQTEQELLYQNALAAYTEAKEQYEIQVNQNASDIKEAELGVKFARMDLEKYLGASLARKIIEEVGIEPYHGDKAEERADEQDAPAPDPEDLARAAAPPERPEIDFSKYAHPDRLGDGEARQKLRELEDNLALAKRELILSQTQLEGTQRLAKKDFVTQNELEKDEMTVERNRISEASAETSRQLFITYEFPKQAEKLLSDYEEALRQLERARKLARAKLAQAEAKWKSEEARFELQATRRRELKEQIEKCVICAERPGLVVYAGSDHPWRNEEPMQEGATVRERQQIITIPDMTKMAVEVKVHESAIKRVKKEQVARIRVDAYPDEELTGRVVKVAVLPDAQNRWMNPDIKVYNTTIGIEGTYDWLKPGMSAEVEILIEELDDVLHVPIQAVFPSNGGHVCYVARVGRGPERRTVVTGEFNEQFIVVEEGLQPGERVLLRAPVDMTVGAEASRPESRGRRREKQEGEQSRGEGERPERSQDTDKEGGRPQGRPARGRPPE